MPAVCSVQNDCELDTRRIIPILSVNKLKLREELTTHPLVISEKKTEALSSLSKCGDRSALSICLCIFIIIGKELKLSHWVFG